MIRKNKFINFLLVLAFPFHGLGSYVSLNINPTAGYLVAVFPCLLILTFYALDSLYQQKIQIKVNSSFIWVLLYAGVIAVSMFKCLANGVPNANIINTTAGTIMSITPFFAFIVVYFYNSDNEDFDITRPVMLSFSILLGMNVLGSVAGVHSIAHGFEGRMSFPFFGGIYSAANVIAILSIMLLPYFKKFARLPVYFTLLCLFYGFNMFLFFDINSRLTTLIFLLIVGLYATNLMKGYRLLFGVSWLMVPLLLSFAFVVYQILSMPVFTAIMQRVDVEDVTTFNGRSYLWEASLDWVWNDRRGLIFGNGHKGYGVLNLFDYVVRKWNVPEEVVYDLHPHSSLFYVAICQGLFGMMCFIAILFNTMKYYFQRGAEHNDRIFYPVMLFMLYLLQVDSFVAEDMGLAIIAVMAAPTMIRKKELPQKPPAEDVLPQEMQLEWDENE